MTYRQLFAVREFRVFFLAVCANVASGTLAGLALATLVFARTGSPLLAALSMFGPAFAQLAGALTMMSIADQLPPRMVLATSSLVLAISTAVLAVPGMPIAAMLAIILAEGVVGSIAGGTRWGLLTEILPDDAYVLGRSVLNMAMSTMQIAGFATGGVLLVVLSPRAALLVAAMLAGVGAVVTRFGLTQRPARAEGRPSIRETWRVNRQLWSGSSVRVTYAALWLPNGLVVGCEALFVPYAPEAAGVLFIAGALGMLCGDAVTGRFVSPRLRRRLVSPVQALLALPYLAFALALPVPLAAILVAAASVGFGAGIMLQERLVALVPEHVRGQALGLHSAGMLTMQGVAATVSGTLAELMAPGEAMACMAGASLVVTALLWRPMRRPAAPLVVAPTDPLPAP
ncbi:MFS transporter [Nocardioidaceae bacterium SCSIO 66511]|nr:MFS transporter [Nocardioidaceae bacterium SCSIO 66511]